MQSESTEDSQQSLSITSPPFISQSSHDGFQHHDRPTGPRQRLDSSRHGSSRDASPSSSSQGSTAGRPIPKRGQRVSDYENSCLPSTPRRPAGFKVIRSPARATVVLPELPDEVWGHVMSHLDRDTHHAMALVSRRFHRISSTQHTWRQAFMNAFPGQKDFAGSTDKSGAKNTWNDAAADLQPSVRFFARLSRRGTWREEYFLRTSLMRSLSRGSTALPKSQLGKGSPKSKTNRFPMVTYFPKLSSTITNLDASFSDVTAKEPRAIHGAASTIETSVGVPLTGRIHGGPRVSEHDYHMWEQFGPHSVPYGLGDSPTFTPNVMDVSMRFGTVGFASYPGGIGLHIGVNGSVMELGYGAFGSSSPDVPLALSRRGEDCVTAAWIAKVDTIPRLTENRIGILTGSALGFISGYAIGDLLSTQERHHDWRTETVLWAISPGVPIIAIKVDEEYTKKRMSAGRAWAVALNALGEVFTLSRFPDIRFNSPQSSWDAGKSAIWNIIPSTRRQAHADAEDPSNGDERSCVNCPAQEISELNLDEKSYRLCVRSIDDFCEKRPSQFRDQCAGWDMRRRLEVDFSAGDADVYREHIFVVTCGYDMKSCPPNVRRYTRKFPSKTTKADTKPPPGSIFDAVDEKEAHVGYGWSLHMLSLEDCKADVITASAIDMSNPALTTVEEEDLEATLTTSGLPGRRGRWLAIGTDSGAIVIWNGRSAPDGEHNSVRPIRFIKTESPEVSCLATTALYVVHGGSDGRLQAWDPLGSTSSCIRNILGRQSSSPTRTANRTGNSDSAVAVIFLDPNPAKLRGLAACGRSVRCWSYSAAAHVASRKRRGSRASRRELGSFHGHMKSEKREVDRERRERAQERARLRASFMMGDLSEEEMLLYAQMLSEEAAAADGASSPLSTEELLIPEESPSCSQSEEEDIKLALKLSQEQAAVEAEAKAVRISRDMATPSRIAHQEEEDLRLALELSERQEEEDLKLALELSQRRDRTGAAGPSREPVFDDDSFPDLGGASDGSEKGKGTPKKGKGKGKSKWVKWSPS